jgi:hypothetical protein
MFEFAAASFNGKPQASADTACFYLLCSGACGLRSNDLDPT